MFNSLSRSDEAACRTWATEHNITTHWTGIPLWQMSDDVSTLASADEVSADTEAPSAAPPPSSTFGQPKAAPAPSDKPRTTFGPPKGNTTPTSKPLAEGPYPEAQADFDAVATARVWVEPCNLTRAWEAFCQVVPDRKAFALVERAMLRLEKTTDPATWRPTLLIFLRDRYFLVGSSQGAYVPRVEVPKRVRVIVPAVDEVEV